MSAKRIPTYHGRHLLLGCLPGLKDNTINVLSEAHRQCGDALRMRFAHLYCYSFIHPDLVKRIFLDNPENYTKDSRGFKVIQSVLGKGILTSEGELWRRQRNSANQVLKQEHASKLTESVAGTLAETLRSWEEFEELDINMHMSLLAFACFDRACFGVNLDRVNVQSILEKQNFLSRYLSQRSRTAFNAPLWIPTKDNQKFLSVKREMLEIARGLIDEHRGTFKEERTLLARIMKDNELTDGVFDEQMIQDELYAFFVSGNESVGLTMSWFWHVIGQSEKYLNQLIDEIDTVVGKDAPTVEHLEKMPLLDAVFKEILRLYPPIFQLARRAVKEDAIGDYRLPKNSLVIICLYLIHRHKDFWEGPDDFHPERFLKKDVHERHMFSYMPFGRGPNQCLGYTIANIEMKCMAIMILQRYIPSAVKPQKTGLKTLFTLYPEEPIYVKWFKRP